MIELLEIQSHGQRFALPLSALQGISELNSLAPIPRAPPSIRGLVSFRGELLVGVELSALLGQSNTGIVDLRRIITLTSQTMKMAILGEKVLSVRSAPKDLFRPEPGRFAFVAGIDENFVSLLDPDLLVAHVLQLLGQLHE
jgi:purine-binding chemotaxis protein CheW